jgi:hypothetical protein
MLLSSDMAFSLFSILSGNPSIDMQSNSEHRSESDVKELQPRRLLQGHP